MTAIEKGGKTTTNVRVASPNNVPTAKGKQFCDFLFTSPGKIAIQNGATLKRNNLLLRE